MRANINANPLLDVFGEDGLRSYILGHLEGIADAMEDLEERDTAEDEEDEQGSEPF